MRSGPFSLSGSFSPGELFFLPEGLINRSINGGGTVLGLFWLARPMHLDTNQQADGPRNRQPTLTIGERLRHSWAIDGPYLSVRGAR